MCVCVCVGWGDGPKIEEMSDNKKSQFLKTHLGCDRCCPDGFACNNSFKAHTGSSVHFVDHVTESGRGEAEPTGT